MEKLVINLHLLVAVLMLTSIFYIGNYFPATLAQSSKEDIPALLIRGEHYSIAYQIFKFAAPNTSPYNTVMFICNAVGFFETGCNSPAALKYGDILIQLSTCGLFGCSEATSFGYASPTNNGDLVSNLFYYDNKILFRLNRALSSQPANPQNAGMGSHQSNVPVIKAFLSIEDTNPQHSKRIIYTGYIFLRLLGENSLCKNQNENCSPVSKLFTRGTNIGIIKPGQAIRNVTLGM